MISTESCLYGRQHSVSVMVGVAEIRNGSTVFHGRLPEGTEIFGHMFRCQR
jgi:hypothetical protein